MKREAIYKEALYYEKASNQLTICQLCPHHCRLKPGQSGVCHVRKNDQGRLITENFGQITALALDPIEKKPLNRFYPGSRILSAGSFGCNLRCPFCQNHEIASAGPGQVESQLILPDKLAQLAVKYQDEGNIGIAFTYNEPIVWYEYVLEAAKAAKDQSLATVLVSNGFICRQPLLDLLPVVDAWNIDLKAFNEDFYTNLVKGRLDTVMETIRLASYQCHVEVTTLVIPGKNDQPGQMHAQAEWLSSISPDIPLHLSRFFPRYQMTDLEPTPAQTLYELAEIAGKYLNYVYLGNL